MGGSDGCFFSQCSSDRKNSKLDNVHSIAITRISKFYHLLSP